MACKLFSSFNSYNSHKFTRLFQTQSGNVYEGPVLSGDSLLLRGKPGPQGQLPKERILNLADVSAPRMGNSSREDEPWAFESREFLRSLVIGKEVGFIPTHSLPSNEETQRDFGHAEFNGGDLATELLKNGWVKCSDRKRDPTEEDMRRKDIETEARNAAKGIWNPHGPQAYTVNHSMPEDSQAFLVEHKGKQLDALVEQVRDGTTVRARLFISDPPMHQMVNVTMTAVRSPRPISRQGEAAEPWGDEAKYFTETRLLQRNVKIELLSMPAQGPAPFQQNSTAPIHTASIFIGNVIHPNGNIAEHLVASGLARIVDWHAGLMGAQGMERLRAAERSAKDRRLCLYTSAPGSINKDGASMSIQGGKSQAFDGVVTRIWSGDQISVLDQTGKERRLQLSSVRAPKSTDPKQAFYASEAKEYLRKRLVGKTVLVQVDFLRPAEGEFDEREYATIKFIRQNVNIGEQIIEKGLATALRHKKDDENRSPDYDKFIIAEKAAQDESRGVHSGKEQALPRIGNASETATKANSFLSGFRRQGRMPAVVDYVSAGSRFRILLPKENQFLTLALAGIRAPRNAPPPGRPVKEKPEAYGPESAEFSTRRYMQRDVEIEIEATDKFGSFIGTLYLNKTENAAIELVKEGLATVHMYSAESLSWSKQLFDAEEEAKARRKNIWSDYNPEADIRVEENKGLEDAQVLKTEYLDIIVSAIRTTPTFSFSVQILNTEGIASLEKLMKDFSLHHRTASAPRNYTPKQGELVSAKFSDGSWYRARIRRVSPMKKEAEVTFIDYGNQETVSFSEIRPLDVRFTTLPGQAYEARLSFVKLANPSGEYGEEAINQFKRLCDSRRLVANIDYKEGSLLHLRLIDPSDPAVAIDPTACINVELARDGLATLDRKGCKYFKAYPGLVSKVSAATQDAKRDRAGMFEFGDIEEDEDDY